MNEKRHTFIRINMYVYTCIERKLRKKRGGKGKKKNKVWSKSWNGIGPMVCGIVFGAGNYGVSMQRVLDGEYGGEIEKEREWKSKKKKIMWKWKGFSQDQTRV